MGQAQLKSSRLDPQADGGAARRQINPRRQLAGARVNGFTQTECKEAMMATGTVKFFNTKRGFGFIAPSDGSKDVFVHISAVERAGMRTLVEGQKVSYDIVTDRGKQAAANLQAA
jgi:CspA family cold shock protein